MMPTQYEEIPCKSALNRVQNMGFSWSLNPYQGCYHACRYCFARFYAQRADRDPGDGFSSRVGIKINVVSVLRHELSKPSWHGEMVAFGTATDPYQPIEGRYQLTRGCLEAFCDYRTPVSLITKGTMILRDIDVLVELSKRAKTSVSFSIPTIDEEVWKKTEPGTASPVKRLYAMKRLVEAGIEAGVGMAPILPGISDSPKQLEATVSAAVKAGACFLWAGIVYLKPGTKEFFLNFLSRQYPHLISRYQKLFPGVYAPKAIEDAIKDRVQGFKRKYPIDYRKQNKLAPPEKPIQLSLIL